MRQHARLRARATVLATVLCGSLACEGAGVPAPAGDPPARTATRDMQVADSARNAFAASVDEQLLDAQVHELRGQLGIKVRNTNPDDPEAPLADRDLPSGAAPGPHTYLGVLHAEVGILRTALEESSGRPPREWPRVSVEGDRVYVGPPGREVLVLGHRHGEALYVPVKLFARPYGAYVRVACPLANCGSIWPRPILLYMKQAGYTSSAGVLEGHLEGLLDSVDVRKLPTG
jgi:hypothetical protein